MNVNKIMTDILKDIKNKKTVTHRYAVDDKYFYFNPDGNRAYKIPVEDFLIDYKKAWPNMEPMKGLINFFKDIDSVVAYKTNEIRRLEKFNVVKIANDKTYAWINENYLKEFDKDCFYHIAGPKAPVFIEELGEIVGLILPVKVEVDND